MERTVSWPYKKEFVCHRCGNCCRGDGYVDLVESDIARAALFLKMTEEEFLEKYTVKQGDEYILKDQDDKKMSCIFLFADDEGNWGCRIQPAKPTQCKGFPFLWRPKSAVAYCEGLRALEGLPPTKKRKIS